jgi:hypothetical protein
MTEPARPELHDRPDQVCQMRFRTKREVEGNPDFIIWSFTQISDLRPRNEREP